MIPIVFLFTFVFSKLKNKEILFLLPLIGLLLSIINFNIIFFRYEPIELSSVSLLTLVVVNLFLVFKTYIHKKISFINYAMFHLVFMITSWPFFFFSFLILAYMHYKEKFQLHVVLMVIWVSFLHFSKTSDLFYFDLIPFSIILTCMFLILENIQINLFKICLLGLFLNIIGLELYLNFIFIAIAGLLYIPMFLKDINLLQLSVNKTLNKIYLLLCVDQKTLFIKKKTEKKMIKKNHPSFLIIRSGYRNSSILFCVGVLWFFFMSFIYLVKV